MGINASGTAYFCLLVEALTYFFPAYYYILKGSHFRPGSLSQWICGYIVL